MSRILLAAAVVGLSAGMSEAGSLYYGLGLGYSSATSLQGPGSTTASEGSFPVLGLTAGYRIDAGSYFVTGEADIDAAFGAELEYFGTTCSAGASGPYFCTIDAVVRLRSLIGMPVGGNWEGFVSAGAVAVMGTSATSPGTSAANTNVGFTAGIGAQGQLLGSGTTRIELVYDQANSSVTTPGGYDPEYESWGIKATWLF